ncbi:MAG TPA: NAD(P)/FAD-dependent oxidoreductase [Rhodocyclaceae bacterium]|nr:NAD(P)/FAD-dependent oxidoreductase [Rhodocyclaceae bacterium]
MTGVCDVLVVGLGPAGGAAAWAAASRGLKVIAIDRKKVIGEPVQCAEFIPMPIARFARTADVIRQRVEGMRSVLPSGESERAPFSGLVIDRAKFDRGLAAMAEEAGAEIRTESVLEELDLAQRTARVRQGEEWSVIHYQLLIAADGPYSRVAKLLGLPRLEMVHSRQYSVPLLQPQQDTTIWLSGEYPGGYAWLFPRGAEANLGIGIDYRYERDAKHPLDKLHEQLVAAGTVGPEILRRTGGGIPVGGMREHLVFDRVMFAGDAAGLTHPITGAGIAAAVSSGEMAGSAAALWVRGEAGALNAFEEDVRELYGPTIERALRARAALESIWKTPAADADAEQRRGWIAFNEYFAA